MSRQQIEQLKAELTEKGLLEISREEYLDCMTFQRTVLPPFMQLFGILGMTEQEWIKQGATPEELDLSAFPFRQPKYGGIPAATGYFGGQKEVVLEETDEYVILRDKMGRRKKLCKGVASIALPLDYPVRTMDDWLKVKPHYEFTEDRFGENWQQVANERVDAGLIVRVFIPGGFDEPRQLMGEENLCLAFYEYPEMIRDMLDTIGDTACKVLDRVSQAVQIDELFVHEDMAGKSGSLVGPKQINEFISPYYHRVWDMLAERGVKIFSQDSDGNMDAVIPAFLDAGLNCMFPMEPAAGMDIVKVREQHGRKLAFQGGIDKHVLRRSKEEIRAELEYKISPIMATGGIVFSGDHRVPNGTSLENFRYYVLTAWEILLREADKLGLN